MSKAKEERRWLRRLDARRQFAAEHAAPDDSVDVEETAAEREQALARRAACAPLKFASSAECVRWLGWKRIAEAMGYKAPRPEHVPGLEREDGQLAQAVQRYVDDWSAAGTAAGRRAAQRHLAPVCAQLATRAHAEIRQRQGKPTLLGAYLADLEARYG